MALYIGAVPPALVDQTVATLVASIHNRTAGLAASEPWTEIDANQWASQSREHATPAWGPGPRCKLKAGEQQVSQKDRSCLKVQTETHEILYGGSTVQQLLTAKFVQPTCYSCWTCYLLA